MRIGAVNKHAFVGTMGLENSFKLSNNNNYYCSCVCVEVEATRLDLEQTVDCPLKLCLCLEGGEKRDANMAWIGSWNEIERPGTWNVFKNWFFLLFVQQMLKRGRTNTWFKTSQLEEYYNLMLLLFSLSTILNTGCSSISSTLEYLFESIDLHVNNNFVYTLFVSPSLRSNTPKSMAWFVHISVTLNTNLN